MRARALAAAAAGLACTAAVATTSAPAATTTAVTPRPPVVRHLIGCRPEGATFRYIGSRYRRTVALTFDDGPGIYTQRVINILRAAHVPATFFIIGSQVRGREYLLRRELAYGYALGNHTYTHANVSGGGVRQMLSTQGAIRRATGYTPCVFRPPYGAFSSITTRESRSLGMNLIFWSVDPRDWALPGSGAIYSRVVGGTRNGAIILMHDGGGYRGQTVAALPGIIRTLKARGYSFATVPQLLGLPPRYSYTRS